MARTLADALMPPASQYDDQKTPKNENKLSPTTNTAATVVASSTPKVEEPEVQYDDFSKRTATRDFELVVEERSLFVNGYWLAELSPFFYNLFFGGFSEQHRRSATLRDDTYDCVLELLRCVIDCPVRKPIDEDNVNDLLDMSEVYDLKALHTGCVKYIHGHLGDMSDELVLDLLQTAAKHKTDTALLNRLVSHVSNSLPVDQLESLRGKVDSDVLVDMYIVKTRALCNDLEMERARNATSSATSSATSNVYFGSMDVAAKKRKLAPDAVDPKIAFACIRCKRDGRAPATSVTAFCPRCGSYRCTPTCTRSTCKGH